MKFLTIALTSMMVASGAVVAATALSSSTAADLLTVNGSDIRIVARHGADDLPGDDRGGRRHGKGGRHGGADDGPNHT